MDLVDIFLIVAIIACWLVVLMMRTVRVSGNASMSAYELHRRAETGDGEAKQLLEQFNRQPRFEGAIELKQIIMLILAVILTSLVLETWAALVVSMLAGICVLWLAHSERIARISQRVWNRYEPLITTKIRRWQWLENFSPLRRPETYQVNSTQELQMLIEKSAHIFDSTTRRRLKASLAFDDYLVADIMTPASVVDSIDMSESLGPLVLDGLHKTAHSRFPVIDQDINHIVGMLYLRDIVELRSAKSTVKDAMDSRVFFIHEDQSLSHALHGFLRSHHHLFIVVNDYRETVGVVSLEDVLETLIGQKIVDEFDQFDDLRAVAATNPRHNNKPKGTKDI